jgi:hypothetical protein
MNGSQKEWEMKKSTFPLSAATALAAAVLGMAPSVQAAPSADIPQQDPCTVHVLHHGSIVDVKWC